MQNARTSDTHRENTAAADPVSQAARCLDAWAAAVASPTVEVEAASILVLAIDEAEPTEKPATDASTSELASISVPNDPLVADRPNGERRRQRALVVRGLLPLLSPAADAASARP